MLFGAQLIKTILAQLFSDFFLKIAQVQMEDLNLTLSQLPIMVLLVVVLMITLILLGLLLNLLSEMLRAKNSHGLALHLLLLLLPLL